MKVSEAKTKVCPFINPASKDVYLYTNDDGIDVTTKVSVGQKCICDNCMAWEWYAGEEDEDYDLKEGYCKRLGQ